MDLWTTHSIVRSPPAFQVQPLIALSAPRIVRCGDFGHETVVKILTNMLCAVQDCAMGEVMMIAKKSGVDLKLLLGFDVMQPSMILYVHQIFSMHVKSLRTSHTCTVAPCVHN